jgi:hypothetical protein
MHSNGVCAELMKDKLKRLARLMERSHLQARITDHTS